MKFNLTDDQIKEIGDIRDTVESQSKVIDSIVKDIIRSYSKDLDNYVDFIRECLADEKNPPTDVELDDWCLNLSTYIYFAGGMCEQLGIRDDISKAVYREIYNSSRSELDKGTVADKDSIAELNSQQEYVTNVCYNRAYKIMKAKVASAQELLGSVKKVVSRRLTEMELSHIIKH